MATDLDTAPPPPTPSPAPRGRRASGGMAITFVAFVMLALTPVIFVYVMVMALWQDAILPMIRPQRSQPASDEELRKIIEADRAKNPRTYHTPES